MILSKNKEIFKRIIAFNIVFFMFLGLVFSQNTFALNNISGKASNFSGYRILDNHTIELWVDKGGGSAEPSQFIISEGIGNSGNKIPILNVSNGSDRNISGIVGKIPQGQSYILTTSNGSFKAGSSYTLTINNNLSTGSGALGWFTSHKDISLSFSIPNSISSPNNNSNYLNSTKPISDSWPENNSTNVAVEGNPWISTSIPVENYDAVKSGLILKKNGVPVKYNNYLYTGTIASANNNADIFSPVVNDDHTFFYIPLTVGGRDTSFYNLQADSQYELLVPEMKMINGQTIPQHSIIFYTASSTVATQFDADPSVSAVGDNLKINWTASQENKNVSPAPSGYNVYASTDKYWNYVKLNTSPITGTSFVTSNCGLLSNTTYYFRVSALSNKNILTVENHDMIESGFSNVIAGKMPVDVTAPDWPSTSKVNTLDVKQNTLQLDWTPAHDSTGVKVYRIYKNDLLIGTVNADTTNYNITALEADKEYTFKIQAGDGANNWSNNGLSVNVRTLQKDVPIPDTIKISSEHNSLEIASTPVTEAFTSNVYDQNNVEMQGKKVNWSIVENAIGVSISDAGVLTIEPFASIGTITVKGTVDGSSISSTKQFEIKVSASENTMNNEEVTKAIESSGNSDTIGLPISTSNSIVIDSEALQDINAVDKPIVINVNNTLFQLKLSDVNLNGNKVSDIQQLHISNIPVDESTGKELDTDSAIDNLLGGSFKMSTVPFKLSVIAVLKNGTTQQVSFNNPVKISIPSHLGLNLLDNQTLRICRFNIDTGKWEDKGPAELNNFMINFNTSVFSYWTVMVKTVSNTGSQTGENTSGDTGTQTGGNTSGNTGTQTEVNTGVNTEGNKTGTNSGDTSTVATQELTTTGGKTTGGTTIGENVTSSVGLAAIGSIIAMANTATEATSSANSTNTSGATVQNNENTSVNSDTISSQKVDEIKGTDDSKKESSTKTSKKSPTKDKQINITENLLGKMTPINWIAVIISLLLIYRIVFVILKNKKNVDKK